MALQTQVTYTTLTEFQTFTRVAAQQSIVLGAWTPFALHAEILIDSYIGYVVPFDSSQPLKFPTIAEDGSSSIPDDIKKAHIELTSWLILQGEPSASTTGGAKSEQWSSSGYSVTYKGGEQIDTVSLGLPPLVLRLLKRYNTNIGGLTY